LGGKIRVFFSATQRKTHQCPHFSITKLF